MQIRTAYKPEAVASRDKGRTSLSDPYLDVEGEKIVATDGHRLVAVPVETDPGETSGYIARELLKIARKKAKKSGIAKIVDRQELEPYEIEWPASPDHVGDKFPDWRAGLPKFKEGDPGTHTIGLNAALLKGIADALGGNGMVALTFRLQQPDDQLDPFLVRAFGGDREEIGVLMPCQLDRKTGKVAPQAAVVDLPPTEAEKKAAERAELEDEADELLEKGGSAELNAKELKGEATARKKGSRR